MNTPADCKNNKFPRIKALALAIAAGSALSVSPSHAGPTGGVVVDGGGSITQSGSNTRIDQSTDRLSLQWDTFNVAGNERVEFVQPSSSSTALNRILDNNGSRILGQIDANGHVILMNPNGIFFGQGARVDVGGLVASGLNINSDDFMNGELAFAGVGGKAGTVVNRGIINAATGGNVALLGKSVANHGLISANLGHVALAAGSEAVVTFDDQGLIGVRIDKETLAREAGSAAVNNTGSITASGGKILLNASVSADLFSQAVNHGGMAAGTSAVVHDDGSFTLGSGNKVVSAGKLDVSTAASADDDAGYVVVAGEQVDHKGAIYANAEGGNRAGQVYLEASDAVNLSAYSRVEANNNSLNSGKVSLQADQVVATSGAKTSTSGATVIAATSELSTAQIATQHLYLQSIGNVSQNGAITATGNTHLNILGEADVRLTHNANDFNTVSLDSAYTTRTQLTDSNSVSLGQLDINDSSLAVRALGSGASIDQVAGSRINVNSSELSLAAADISLGANDSSTHLYYGTLNLEFGRTINTNGSIDMTDDTGLGVNSARIIGRTHGADAIELKGGNSIDLHATLDDENLSIGRMLGSSASLSGLTQTTQTGPVTLSGALSWNSYSATLDSPENDIASLQGSGAVAFGQLTYVDKNDVLLQNLDLVPENTLNVSSVGAGRKIQQAANTVLNADFIKLNADNIYLGASGSSSVNAGYSLEIDFGRYLHVNGPYSVGSYAPNLRISGNAGDNIMVFGGHASSDSFAGDGLMASLLIDLGDGQDTALFNSEFAVGNDEYWQSNKLDMGAGDDRVYFNRNVYIPTTLGLGRDLARVWDSASYYDFEDFQSDQDRLFLANP